MVQQGCRSFTGPFGPGRASVGLVCSWRSVRSLTTAVVEVGSSRPAVPLLSHVLVWSCIPAFQATCYRSRRNGGGDCKSVVARARGRRCLVVVLRCAWGLLWAGVGRNPCRLVRP